jgi:glycosyltransferase involved in cell wall biosynthesis
MRIAMVDPSSFSLPYDHHLCRGLAKLGHDVTLYCGQRSFYAWGKTPYNLEQTFYGITEQIGDQFPGGAATILKGIEHIIDSGRLIRQLTTTDPDVVHVQWAPLPVVDRLAVELYDQNRSTVHTVHNAEPLHGSGSPLQRFGSNQVREGFDTLVVHTEVTRNRLQERGIGTPTTVVPHPALDYQDLSTSESCPNIEGIEIGDAGNTLLFFGNLRPYKNPEMAIRTLAALSPELRDETVLLFVGAARMNIEPLQKLADCLGVADRVRWNLQYVPDEIVPTVFSAADITLLPYTDIDQSGVMMTSLGLRTPVVASAVGGFPETIEDGIHGRLHEPGNPQAAASAVKDVLSWTSKETINSIDQLVADRYTPERVAARTVELYESL